MLSDGALFFSGLGFASVGTFVLWKNARRFLNQCFFGCSITLALWSVAWHYATTSPASYDFWWRGTCMLSAVLPLFFLVVSDSIVPNQTGRFLLSLLRRRWPLLLTTAIAATIPLAQSFTPPGNTIQNDAEIFSKILYLSSLVAHYAFFLYSSFREIRYADGGRRIDLQLWSFASGMIGGGATYLAFTFVLSSADHSRTLILLALIVFSVIAVIFTTHRIYDLSQIIRYAGADFVLIASAATIGSFSAWALWGLLWLPINIFFAAAAGWWVIKLLQGPTDSLFVRDSSAWQYRRAAFAAAQREKRIDGLERAFVQILRDWGKSETALVLHGMNSAIAGGGVEMSVDTPVFQTMRILRWATPERLGRERLTPDRDSVACFLKEHNLGLLVVVEGPTCCGLLGVGHSRGKRPYTFPRVGELLELASIFESSIERATQAEKAQHAEQLAAIGLLGASLAHEIRNPLVSIKTFAQLLPKRYDRPEFREKFFSLVRDEVTRIDRLTEQLLDLSSPRIYEASEFSLHPLLRHSIELLDARMNDARIKLITELTAQPDTACADPSAIKQVVLNLALNALQAIESQRTDDAKWVKLSTRNLGVKIEIAVEDSGPGFPDHMRSRLFIPFQSTKSTGFGLGLAICSDILGKFGGRISVDPKLPGKGAVFRVWLPTKKGPAE